jgi:archaellum component FlaC
MLVNEVTKEVNPIWTSLEQISMGEIEQLFSNILNKPIKFVEMSDESFIKLVL